MRSRVLAHIQDVRSLAVGAALGLAAPPLLVLFLLSGPLSLAGGLGLLLLAGVILSARWLAQVQYGRFGTSRWRTVNYYKDPPPGFGLAWLRMTVKEPQTWRDMAWLLVQFPLGLSSFVAVVAGWLCAIQFVAAPLLLVLLPKPTSFDPAVFELTGRSGLLTWVLVPVGIGLALVLPRVARLLVRWQAVLSVNLLEQRRQNLEARLEWVTSTRTSAVDASAAELQRIERDLHDGAQARLISVTMSLGMAEHIIDTNVDNAKVLLAEARADTATALTELRHLVRGIHPPVLADRGLGAAVEALRLTSRVPVDLDLRLKRRLKLAVESAAYFVIAESLVNAIKHSGARRIGISVVDRGERLTIDVSDDGHGGADPSLGTGLQGIQRRLSAFDGALAVSSPPGGPTVLTMELSCGS
ncbi:sensor histidine kinase [Dactylosporangium sp. NPDC051541]|uniref:sensor histidine kinase n=1 Tax=Dactylosporangium sp. NPDC051541 TaxID=3363977 RepID=UPI00378B1933